MNIKDMHKAKTAPRGANSISRGNRSFSKRSDSFAGAKKTGGRPSSFKGRGNSSSFSARRPAKKRFKADFIDEKLFINKAVAKTKESYTPKHTFSDFGLNEVLMRNVAEKGYVYPSPIQDQSIPVVMQGNDVIGIANTGTGKTAAFLLPLIHKLANDNNHKVLILTPTRELAQQIEAEFKDFTRGMRLWSVSCVGGAPIGKQISELSRGVHVVIGTPGRVKDLIERGKIVPERFGSIVLDEADRMLDMGFVNDMRFILARVPASRQGLFFSATMSPAINILCSDFLQNPTTVSVKTRDTASSIEQDIVRTRGANKIDLLHEILARPECRKVLIFREMKRHADELGKELAGRGFKALALHGDMRNRERERAVKALAAGHVQVVIATDVAARGIDIPDISHVINYDIPNTYDTYIHRIGRTGRGDKVGVALTFV